MLKLVYVIYRKPGMSRQDFHHYWRHVHTRTSETAPERFATFSQFIRYTQGHQRDTSVDWFFRLGRNPAEPPDGVAEVWYPDYAPLEAMANSDAGRATMFDLLQDESHFIDLQRSAIFLAKEEDVYRAPDHEDTDMSKLVVVLYRKPELSAEEFHKRWRNEQRPLGGEVPVYSRYTRSHQTDTPVDSFFRYGRNAHEVPPDGVAEFWFPDYAALETMTQSDAGKAAMHRLLCNDATFIDMRRSPVFLADEWVGYRASE